MAFGRLALSRCRMECTPQDPSGHDDVRSEHSSSLAAEPNADLGCSTPDSPDENLDIATPHQLGEVEGLEIDCTSTRHGRFHPKMSETLSSASSAVASSSKMVDTQVSDWQLRNFPTRPDAHPLDLRPAASV